MGFKVHLFFHQGDKICYIHGKLLIFLINLVENQIKTKTEKIKYEKALSCIT